MGGMKLPVGMTRRALSYDDNLEAPMSTPPHDISINNLWRRPIIPERKFTHLAEVRQHLNSMHGCFILYSLLFSRAKVLFLFFHQEDESGAVSQPTLSDSTPSRSPSVVKAKASSIIMNSLITSTLDIIMEIMLYLSNSVYKIY